MTDSRDQLDQPPEVVGERRTNLVLRALIDEMLERVREMHSRTDIWDPNERARAEADLEAIMARVRLKASKAEGG